MSNRKDALTVLTSRLSSILVANGYTTNAGQLVFIGESPQLGPDDKTASLAVVLGDSEPGHQGERLFVRLPVRVEVIVPVGVSAWATLEDALGDVKKAVETDHDLNGTLLPRGLERGPERTLEREAGSTFVGVGIEYVLAYGEDWGKP